MNTDRIKKILLVGGGSGGHVVPVFELYQKLKKSDLKILVVGSGGKIESYVYGKLPEYRKITTGKMHRVLTWKNGVESLKLAIGLIQSLSLILSFRPTLIFSKGGYVSLPIIFWARFFNIPYFIHESDIQMGMTNSYAAKGAKKVFVGYPTEYYPTNLQKKIIYSGQLINTEIPSHEICSFNLDDKKKTLLFLGGSQGAANINNVVFGLPKGTFQKYNVIHQTGEQGLKKAKNFKLESELKNYYPFDFLRFTDGKDMMNSAFRVADVIVTRAGATTIAEAAALNKPLILVPYKHASSDHQNKNSQMLVKTKSVLVIKDDELNPNTLIEAVNSILNDKKIADMLTSNCAKICRQGGLNLVSDQIIKELELR